MKNQWIVVANASIARIFRRDTPADPLIAVAVLDHPASRQKGSELSRDRAGQEGNDQSHTGAHYEPRTDVRRKEHQRFAHEVARYLDAAYERREFGSLCLYAAPAFLGELKQELGDSVRRHTEMAVDSDYTALDVGALEQCLRATHPSP